jgi:hypothetical protein
MPGAAQFFIVFHDELAGLDGMARRIALCRCGGIFFGRPIFMGGTFIG